MNQQCNDSYASLRIGRLNPFNFQSNRYSNTSGNNSFVNQSFYYYNNLNPSNPPQKFNFNVANKPHVNAKNVLCDKSFNYYGPYAGGFNVPDHTTNYLMQNDIYQLRNKKGNLHAIGETNYNFKYELNKNDQKSGINDISCMQGDEYNLDQSCFQIDPTKIPYKAITNFPYVKMNEVLINHAQVPIAEKKSCHANFNNPNLNKTFSDCNFNILEGEDLNVLFPKKSHFNKIKRKERESKSKHKSAANLCKTGSILRNGATLHKDIHIKYNVENNNVNNMKSNQMNLSFNKLQSSSMQKGNHGSMIAFGQYPNQNLSGYFSNNSKQYPQNQHKHTVNHSNLIPNNNSIVMTGGSMHDVSNTSNLKNNSRARSYSDFNNTNESGILLRQKGSGSIAFGNRISGEIFDTSTDNIQYTKSYKFAKNNMIKEEDNKLEDEQDH